MDESKIKIWLAAIGGAILLFLFLYTMYKPNTDSYVHGTIIDKSLAARGATSTVSYTIQGRLYYAYIGRYWNYPIGEKFICYFNHDWPDHVSVDQTAPVFLSSEQFSWTDARINKISSSVVFFGYVIDGIAYERWQSISVDLNTSIGDTVRIAYWLTDPQRSILPIAYSAQTRLIISSDELFKEL